MHTFSVHTFSMHTFSMRSFSMRSFSSQVGLDVGAHVVDIAARATSAVQRVVGGTGVPTVGEGAAQEAATVAVMEVVASALVDGAFSAGSYDNISAIVVRAPVVAPAPAVAPPAAPTPAQSPAQVSAQDASIVAVTAEEALRKLDFSG